MAEFGVNLNFDDGGIVANLKKSAELFDKLSKEVQDFDKISKLSGKGLTSNLVETQTAATNLVKEVTKTNEAIKKGFSQKEISDVALAIAKSTNEAGKFSALMNKVNDARLNGVTADVNDLEEEFVQLIAKARLTAEQMEVVKGNGNEIVVALAAIDGGELEEVASKATVLTKEFASAKGELRALNNAIASGDLQGDDLVVATKRAAELTDTIGDVREKISNLASDTRGIDTLIEGTRAVAAGFAIAEGASALFGEENEDVQKALLKVNAIMAISNGLQEAHVLLLQNSNLRMRAATIARGAYNFVIGAGVGLKKLLTGQLTLESVRLGIATAAHVVYNAVVGKSTGIMKIFKIALASTGVGLLVVGIGLLVANWNKLNNSMGFFNKLANVAKGIVEGLKVGLSGIGNVITTLFTGGGVSGAVEAAKKLGQDMGKATSEAYQKENLKDLEKRQAENIRGIVEGQKRQLAILEAGGKDTSKLKATIANNEIQALKLEGADKADILEKQNEIDVMYAEKRREASQRAADEAKARNEKEKERLKEFAGELQSLRSETTTVNRTNQIESIDDSTVPGQIQRLELQRKFDLEDLKQREETTLKLAKTLEERNKVIEIFKDLELQLSEKSNRAILALEKQSREEYQNAVKENEKETNEILKKGADERAKAKLEGELKAIKLNEDIRIADIDRQLKYDELTLEQRRQLEGQKLELVLRSLQAQRTALGGVNTEETIRLDSLIKDAAAALSDFESQKAPIKDAGQRFKDFIKDSFKIDDEEFGALVEGFGALKEAVLDVINAGYEAELATIDDSISRREDKISELEDLIKEEYDKKKEGQANDYDALVLAKAEEEALVKEDNAKKTAILKEQLRVESAIQAAQQAQSLITAVAGIFAKGPGALGVFGIPIAIAGVISMLALYRNYKNQVKQLNQQAYKGGKISEYLEPGETAKSDRPGHGKGHRIEGTNLYVGADEFITNAKSTASNLPFLKEFNRGTFDDVDLLSLTKSLPDTKMYIVHTREKEKEKEVSSVKGLKDNYDVLKKAIDNQTTLLLEAEARKPVVINRPDGSVEITYHKKDGGKKVEIIRA